MDPRAAGLCPNRSPLCRLGLEPRLPLPSLWRAGGQLLAPALPRSTPPWGCCVLSIPAQRWSRAVSAGWSVEPCAGTATRAAGAGRHPQEQPGAAAQQSSPQALSSASGAPAPGASSLRLPGLGEQAKGAGTALVQREQREPPLQLTHRGGRARELAGSRQSLRQQLLCWKPVPGKLGASSQQQQSEPRPSPPLSGGQGCLSQHFVRPGGWEKGGKDVPGVATNSPALAAAGC